jgi:hypothetical protein
MSTEFGSIAFPNSCLPDVPCKSRVVAVSGATDFEDAASPAKDGWLFFLTSIYFIGCFLPGF